MIGKYQFINHEMQKEISAVIEKDTTLNAEITQLQNSECDCENENTTAVEFPCYLYVILYYSIWYLSMLSCLMIVYYIIHYSL